MNEDKRPSDYLFTVSTTVSALDRKLATDDRFSYLAKNAMRQKLAAHIVTAKMQEKHFEDFSEYRLEVVVMTRGELYSLINAEAERIATRCGLSIDTK